MKALDGRRSQKVSTAGGQMLLPPCQDCLCLHRVVLDPIDRLPCKAGAVTDR